MMIVCSRGQDEEDGPVWYCKVRRKDAAIIVYQHLQHNEVVTERRFRLREPIEATPHYNALETENEDDNEEA
jgi:(2Fe-2S) ferredoxin